jgi:hypothetical protein
VYSELPVSWYISLREKKAEDFETRICVCESFSLCPGYMTTGVTGTAYPGGVGERERHVLHWHCPLPGFRKIISCSALSFTCSELCRSGQE